MIYEDVPLEVIDEAKKRLHILHSRDDENLRYLLSNAHVTIQAWCGEFSFDLQQGRELIYEYVRFAYNNQTEWFYSSFHPQLVTLSMELLEVEEDG